MLAKRLAIIGNASPNHGALVCGSSLAEAYIYHHFFELACRAQIGALSGGGEVVEIDDKAATARAEKLAGSANTILTAGIGRQHGVS